ncbi:glutaredoxin-1 [Entophlyctis helioformis]|nr:glutaredoxin-1 [Entophlyctis helioformis]KAI8926351.1 glutaredoxin-1 [Entophlyctis helioformis]
MSAVATLVENAIKDNAAVVFSKTYCPYCTRAKTLLKAKNVDFALFELDNLANGAEIQAYLLDKTKQRTVPNVFIHQKHIGGSSDLDALNKTGELDKILAA